MITIEMVLLLLALVCFLISTAGVATRINLQSAGLALLALAMILGRTPR